MYCRYNKKKECLYSHVTLASDDNKLEALKKVFNKRVSKLEDSLVNIKNELIGKNSIVNDLKEKINELEALLGNLKDDLKDKNAKIVGLELRLDELEKKQQNDKQSKDKKIKDLENLIKKKPKKEESQDFKCSECEFVAKTKSGLKTHKVRIHTKTNSLQYPVECELCEAKLENERNMKEHLKFHSYKKSTFRCEDCDHCSENFLTMEVHVGKHHSGKFECGLCNYEAKDLEALNLHLSTCQVYVCDDCCYRTTHIHEIKDHLEKIHTSRYDFIIHGKVNLKDPEIIDDVNYSKHELCSST